MTTKLKDKTIRDLIDALNDAGIIDNQTPAGGKQTIYSWIRAGKLRLRKRPHSGWHVVNDDEISQIIEGFSPGGKGFFDAVGD